MAQRTLAPQAGAAGSAGTARDPAGSSPVAFGGSILFANTGAGGSEDDLALDQVKGRHQAHIW
jgi:hypothetical protein